MNPSGILLVDKPSGISSFAVVGWVRRIISSEFGKKIKVGHTGTLDPFATGLMIIVVGDYCKKASEFEGLDKVYEAEIILGKTSSTGDPEGEISDYSVIVPDEKAISNTLKAFQGSITQTPPRYSAIKINGQRAYKLAREGKEFEVPKRQVQIHSIELVDYKYPVLSIKTHVSKGTYIRTLAEDIGERLGTGAYTSKLRRLQVGKYDVKEAIKLEGKETLSGELGKGLAI